MIRNFLESDDHNLPQSRFANLACRLAYPTGTTQAYIDFMVVEHIKALLSLPYIRRRTDNQTLFGYLNQLITEPDRLTSRGVWSVPAGVLMEAVLETTVNDNDPAVACFALQQHVNGSQGRWKAQFSDTKPLYFGKWLLPSSKTLTIEADHDLVLLNLLTQRDQQLRIRLDRRNDIWVTSDEELCLPTLKWSDIQWPLLTAECLMSQRVSSQLSGSSGYRFGTEDFDKGCDLLSSVADDALEIIGEYAPSFLPWIKQTVTALLPLPMEGMTLNSTSAYLAPGLLSISNQRDPLVLAEIFVHEASHQYQFIAMRLGPLVDGTDGNLYYSPFKKTHRPLLYIILTYHAFGNVLLFYRALLRSLSDGATPDRQLQQIALDRTAELERQLSLLESSLTGSSGITENGEALWQPLRSELRRPL